MSGKRLEVNVFNLYKLWVYATSTALDQRELITT